MELLSVISLSGAPYLHKMSSLNRLRTVSDVIPGHVKLRSNPLADIQTTIQNYLNLS